MTKNVAPTRQPAFGQQTLLRSLALLAIALFLAACGTSTAPRAGIQPTSAGGVEVRVKPADAQVVLVPEGESAEGRGAQAQHVEGDYGVFQYDLDEGDYVVRASKAGFETAQATFTLNSEELASAEPITAATLVLQPAATGDTGSGDAVIGTRGLGMLVDPNFSASNLDPDQRTQYELFWNSIAYPDNGLDPYRMAATDNTYEYARNLHTYIQTLLITFRYTGDKAILDEVYEITQVMRDQLKDEWTGTLDGTDGKKDGYLGWAYRYGNDKKYNGKDIHQLNDIKTHALIASVAYALELNRDIDARYAEASDFWQTYLVDHFEAKWRERTGKKSGYPILLRPHTHTYISGMKYHYYMYLLTGKADYLAEAERSSDMFWNNEIKLTDVGNGKQGYVWTRSILSEGGGEDYLHPTTYARYVYADVVELHLEGFRQWGAADLSLFANTISELVLDRDGASGNDWFASDIGGGKSRAGIPSDGSWKRLNTHGWSWSPYALLSAWDETGRLGSVSSDALRDLGRSSEPRAPHIPAGLFIEATLR